tara:strand:- start:49467 stop:51407 length:1941 start_codon:yes stop_codon:yes gene_type:complete
MRSQATHIKKWIPLCLLGLVSLVLSACGGSKSFDIPEPLTDTVSPTVDNSFPNEVESEDFEVDFNVEIIFSELMNKSSLTTERGIKLFSGRSDLESGIGLEERAVDIFFSVVPLISNDLISDKEIVIPATKAMLKHSSGRFALNTEYTVIVDNPARDLVDDDLDTEEDERNFISETNIIDFITEEGEWKQSKTIPNITIEDKGTITESLVSVSANQFSPRLIANARGDTFLIWRQEATPGINQLWASRYTVNNKQWGLSNESEIYCSNDNDICANSHLISEISSTSVNDYDVDINEQGHLAIVWSQAAKQGDFVSIWASIFDGKNWNTVSEINNTGFLKTGNAESPAIALDSNGNAVSIWREYDGQYSRIKTNIFKVGDGAVISSGQWVEAPVFIDTHSQVVSKNPKLSMNDQGVAIAVWEQNTSGLYQIYSNHIRLNQSNDWIGPERIDNISSTNPEFGIGNSSLPIIAIDQNNDAIAIWLKYDGQRNNVWFNRFTGSWGELANYLEGSRLGDASYPGLAIGKNNRVLAYWVQEDTAENSRSLFTSFFTALTGWESGRLMATDNKLSKPIASFDREGNAVLIWQEGIISGEINTRYYSKRTDNWNREESLASSSADVSLTPLLEDGRFLTTWVNDYRLESVLFSD